MFQRKEKKTEASGQVFVTLSKYWMTSGIKMTAKTFVVEMVTIAPKMLAT